MVARPEDSDTLRESLTPVSADSSWSFGGDDTTALLLSFLLLGAFVALAELLHGRPGWSSQASRRLVHAATGLYVVATPYLFTSAAAPFVLGAGFVLANAVSAARGWLRGIHPPGRTSRGTITFPLALLVVLPFSWDDERQFILQTAFLVLAFADPLAAIAGERVPWRQVRIGTATKSAAGSLTFFVVAWALSLFALTTFGPLTLQTAFTGEAIVLSFVLAAVATAVEALGGRGWDNFFIVVAATTVLVLWTRYPDWLSAMATGVVSGVLIAAVSWRLAFLTRAGAIAAGLFAATLIGVGGPGWAVPALAFFVLSSLLSKWSHGRRAARRERSVEPTRRDVSQVYANGAVAWLLVRAFGFEPQAWIYWGFAGSLAAATADTWATEAGPLFRQQPRLILSGRRVPAGTSGAVTWGGTAAGLLGAVVIWICAAATAPAEAAVVGLGPSLIAVVGGGLAGSWVDSLAGATIQAVHRDPATGRIADGHPSGPTGAHERRGWRFVDNDVVNVLCTIAGAAVAMAIAHLQTFGLPTP